MKKYQLTVLLSSITVWVYMVHSYIIMFLLLSVVTLLIDKCLLKNHSSLAVFLNTCLYLTGFFLLKNVKIEGLILPVGYSVFAFSAISYIIDQKKDYKNYSILDLLNYLLFFPKAFAGPIERSDKLILQLNNPTHITSQNLYLSFKLCVFAACCKYVVADTLYDIESFGYYGVNNILTIIIFAIAFYFDFYAYSLFAIAIGKIFGIELSESFNTPYRSKTLKEFWSRWNITLGTWLRDYVYIPLGGNRLRTKRTFINLMLAFLVSAIWHSATIPFIIWGVAHAFFLFIEKCIHVKGNLIYSIWVMALVSILWQCFKVENVSELAQIISQSFTWEDIDLKLVVLFIIGLSFTLVADSKLLRKLIFTLPEQKSFIRCEVAVLSMMLTLVLLYPHSLGINFFYLRF